MTETITGMVDGYITTQLIAACVQLNLATHLAHGATSLSVLEVATQVPAERLEPFLRALESLCFVSCERLGDELIIAALPTCNALKPGGEAYGHAVLSGEAYYLAWTKLVVALRNGTSAFEQAHGTDMWTYLNHHPDAASSFASAMRVNMEHLVCEGSCEPIFKGARVLVDLGAGDGTLLGHALISNRGCRGVAVERPALALHIARTMRELGVDDRCEIAVDDIFKSVPAGDLYILKSVLHNWSDERAGQLLASIYERMSREARLLVIERVRRSEESACTQSQRRFSAFSDLMMLVLFGSRDRTDEENRRLFARSRFSISHVISTPSGVQLYELNRA